MSKIRIPFRLKPIVVLSGITTQIQMQKRFRLSWPRLCRTVNASVVSSPHIMSSPVQSSELNARGHRLQFWKQRSSYFGRQTQRRYDCKTVVRALYRERCGWCPLTVSRQSISNLLVRAVQKSEESINIASQGEEESQQAEEREPQHCGVVLQASHAYGLTGFLHSVFFFGGPRALFENFSCAHTPTGLPTSF